MQRYSEYKDSGVQWLGEIPSHWEVRKMKFTFQERSKKGYPLLPLLAATQNHGVIRKENYENRTVEATKGLETLKLVEEGDFVISLRSFQGGIEICHEKGIISPAYTILRPTNIGKRYFKHLGKSPIFIQLLKSMVTGIREGQNIDYGKLRENLLPIPSVNEQEAIANYLDSVTSKIDTAIAQQQKMIDLLNERKQIIINNAVTKGLDPNVKMKDSGVEWIGEIPEHWEVRRFKTVAKVKSNLVHPKDYLHYPQVSPDCIEKNSGILLCYSSVQDSGVISDNHLFYKGQIVYSKIRPTLNKVIIAPFNGLCSADMYPIETTMERVFVLYQILSGIFSEQVQLVVNERVKMPKINKEELGNIVIVLPSLEEQKEIAMFLVDIVGKIRKSIHHYQNIISLLQERKQIIINDVVTGKVKVV